MDLATLLTDEDAMSALLRRRLAGRSERHWQIADCRVVQTRRRISRRTREDGAPWLGICYRLGLRDAQTGEIDVHWLYAKAYSRGRSEDAWRAAMPAACVIPRLGEPVMHLPELDLVLWTLPNDPVMAQLPAFLDPVAVRPHLPRGPVDADPASGTLRVDEISVVRYEPEEHCLARFAPRDADGTPAIYGKSYAGEEWRDARDGLDALWRQGCADPQAFVVGRPLGSSAALRAVWQEEVRGEPLAGRLAGPDADAALDVLAAALVRLHAGNRFARETRPLADTLETARKWGKKLIQADPGFAPALDAVLFQLGRHAAPPRRLATVHGDFHVDQMHWCDGRIALFDYDNFGLDSPARDLADFVSQLLCREDRKADWPAVAARFVERYRTHCGDTLYDGELDWHLQLMLLRKAYSFFVRHRDGWQSRVTQTLAAAQAGLAAIHRPTREYAQ